MQTCGDVNDHIQNLDNMLPMFTVGGVLPSYLTGVFLRSSFLLLPSMAGALGGLRSLERAAKQAIKDREQELHEKQDDRHDLLRKMLEIKAERGENVNLTNAHIEIDSVSAL